MRLDGFWSRARFIRNEFYHALEIFQAKDEDMCYKLVERLGRNLRTKSNGCMPIGTIGENQQQKAFTAAAARRSTRAYGEVSQSGGPAFGIHVSNQGRFMIVAGGVPLFVNDQIVGGVGCSSGHPDQDEEVAQAGIDAFIKSISN